MRYNAAKFNKIQRACKNTHALYLRIQDEYVELKINTGKLATMLITDSNQEFEILEPGRGPATKIMHTVPGLRHIETLEALDENSSDKELMEVGVHAQDGRLYLSMKSELAKLLKERDSVADNATYARNLFSKCEEFLQERGLIPKTATTITMS